MMYLADGEDAAIWVESRSGIGIQMTRELGLILTDKMSSYLNMLIPFRLDRFSKVRITLLHLNIHEASFMQLHGHMILYGLGCGSYPYLVLCGSHNSFEMLVHSSSKTVHGVAKMRK